MQLVRKSVILLALAVLLLSTTRFTYAQGTEIQVYGNDLFSIEVPAFLTVRAEGSDFVSFAADDIEIDIRLIRPAQTVIDTLGDGSADRLLDIMRFVYADSDYQVEACPDAVEYPCMIFTDAVGLSVFQRALLQDTAESVFYALTFRAPTQAELDAMNPKAILESFRLPQAAAEAVLIDDRNPMFNVVVNGNVNLRSCASTDCAVVGQAANGQTLPVLAQEGDWYEVKWESGTAFIASWLTSRGPDVHVDLTEGYYDVKTSCIVFLRKTRGDTDLSLALYGDRKDDVWVDVYRVNDTVPLEVFGQYDKTFIDTGDPYIHQTYYWGTWWPSGTYRLELELGGESSVIGFDFENGAEHTMYIECD